MDKRKTASEGKASKGVTTSKGEGKITPASAKNASGPGSPGWANGLRQLYDSVVDEPLPDTFKDLLSKLDNKN